MAFTMVALTTAQLREKARDAANSLQWAEAAKLYDMAADVYPGFRGGALASADIAQLRKSANDCRHAAKRI